MHSAFRPCPRLPLQLALYGNIRIYVPYICISVTANDTTSVTPIFVGG